MIDRCMQMRTHMHTERERRKIYVITLIFSIN